jgi:hypothetical protein
VHSQNVRNDYPTLFVFYAPLHLEISNNFLELLLDPNSENVLLFTGGGRLQLKVWKSSKLILNKLLMIE